MAPPKPPPPESLFCPIQEKIEDIRIHIWNTSKGLEGWYHLQEAMKRRQTSLAPFIIVAQGRTIPVTPLNNPKTKMSSYFIVQMIDDDDKQVKVNCLLRGTDAYFMGFQRELVLSEEEQGLEEKKSMERNQEASSSKGKKKTEETSLLKEKKKTEEHSEKGNFYRFKENDMIVPEFLNATKLNIEAGYRKSSKPGGRAAIRHMFRAFSRYQDGTVTDKELEIACYCFMGTVSEPSRLFSLYLEVSRRIASGEFPSLNGHLVNNTDNWGQLGRLVLDARLVDRLDSYRLLPQWCWEHNLVIMR